jgi:hypothetical protein
MLSGIEYVELEAVETEDNLIIVISFICLR